MRIGILSPHRDDAAFSCGLTMFALLRAGADLSVINVYTQSDYAIDLRTVDRSAPPAEAISRARMLEDEAFVEDLANVTGREPASVRLIDLHRLDAPLRLTVQTEQVLASPLTNVQVQQEAEELAAEFAALPLFDFTFAPLALGDHVDHRIVHEAAKLLCVPDRLCLYEDLPYAARIPPPERNSSAFSAALSKSRSQFCRFTLRLLNGPHLKQRLAMHYPSQIAPEVAEEMASYAAQWAEEGSGAERWWATAAAAGRLGSLLQSESDRCTLTEEQQ